MNKVYDAIIIGGGPAGLMAANALHERHIDYLLLEKNDQLAKKLLLTGGKRCNITNNLSVPAFIESLNMKHKKFLYPALSNFNSQDILNFFKIRGLTFSLEQDIKYFPDTGKSQSVRDALLKTIDLNRILYQQSVKSLTYEHDHWVIKTQSDTYDARNVLVATGSKAYPTTGSSGDGFMFAERLGIMLEPLYPAETHVYADEVKKELSDLQGVSIQQAHFRIENSKAKYPGAVLFTHFGLSGPSVLHASEDIARRLETEEVHVLFSLSEYDENHVKKEFETSIKKNELLSQCLDKILTKRLAKFVITRLGLDNQHLKSYGLKDIDHIIQYIVNFKVKIDRVETLEHAFVNAGGISVKELDPQSMMVKKYPGLYFIGEVTDLQGPIGGFNMTIAFSTAQLAAKHIDQIIHP